MSLTDEQIEAYIKDGGDHCPYCGSEDVDREYFNNTWEGADEPATCTSCGKKWVGVYILELEAIEELDEEDTDEEREVQYTTE